MNDFEDFEQTQIHLSFSEQIDQICDDFEAAWQKGNRISIETCLRLVDERARTDLLRELLEIELEICQKNGESLSLNAYLARFPQYKGVVRDVFQTVIAPRRLGDYELIELLGHGGMGVVYRAKQVYLGQTVAIKILPEQYTGDEHAISRFRREMQLIGSLKHPNIVQAYNAGEMDGVHYLVMEFVSGVTLQRLLADRIAHGLGGLSIGAACEVIRQAALGLQHAHQRGLVHRDIKPGNLMLNHNGMVKILDLGLGKFQADVRQGDQHTGPLTQVGTTMGTVDYMAPEQWDDPTTVGIGADIYSLGCTLFFLLCGKPPFDGKNYETNRAKLMAHIVSEPPPLTEANPRISDGLQAVYRSVMKKEPENRLAEPIELAQALEPYSNFEELLDYIPKEILEANPESGHSSSSLHRPEVDTIVTSRRRQTIGKQLSLGGHHCIPWYRSMKFYTISGIVGVIVLLFFLLNALRETSVVVEDPSASHHVTEPVALESAEQLAEKQRIASDLVELPGLSGSWWFSEMPWYLPFVREAVGRTLSESRNPLKILDDKKDGYLNPDTLAVQKWLRGVIQQTEDRLTPPQRQLLNDLLQLADTNLSDEQYHQKLYSAFEHYTGSPTKKDVVDLHTEAVLLHALNAWKTDRNFAQQADQKYAEAILGYEKDTSDSVRQSLAVFALVDRGRLNSGALNRFDVFLQMFDQAFNSSHATNLLKVDILVSLGASKAGKGQYEDLLFDGAAKMLGTVIGKRIHPLSAHIAERHAWSLIDQWKIGAAREKFHFALLIREANSRESSDPFADIYVFHNRHGLAMTARYNGDLATARRDYESIVEDIKVKYEQQQEASERPGQLRYFRDLRERYSNSLERQGDCELFSGAASRSRNINLAKAENLYKQSSQLADSRSSRIVIACRLCLVQALLGKTEDANRTLFQLDHEIDMIPNEVGRFRAKLASEITRAVINVCSPDEETVAKGLERLRQFSNDYARTASPDEDRYRRETMEFRLLYMELMLYHSMLQNEQNSEIVKKDTQSLVDVLKFFQDKPETYPFVRRYNDLVIRALGRDDPDLLADQIAKYRVLEKVELPGNDQGTASKVYFYFPPSMQEQDGLALYFPGSNVENHPKRLFSIKLTRREIKQASNSGQSLPPDESCAELLRLINDDRKLGFVVNLFWDDTSCWPSGQNGLNEQDWPFREICPLKP